jgi:O-antigen ligase
MHAGSSLGARLQVALLVAAFIGYPLVSLFPSLTGLDTQVVSLPYRGAVVLLSMLLLMLNARGPGLGRAARLPLFAFWLAWAAMLLRFLFDVVILGAQPSAYFISGVDFLLFVVGAGLIPALALLQPMQDWQLRSAHRWLGVLTAVVLLAYSLTFESIAEYTPEMTRAQNIALNPITYGSLGVILILLAFSYRFEARFALRRVLVGFVALALGGWALITSASRGPLLALLVVGIFALVARARSVRARVLTAVGSVAVLATVAVVVMPMIADFSSDSVLASRIEGFEEDTSTLERLYLLQASWDIFLSNPVLGGAIAEPVLHNYPHNILLEGLMVGGLGLGVLLLAITIYCLRRAFDLLAAGDDRGFIGAIAVFTVVMAMISGSLYTGPEFWYVFVLLIASHPASRRVGHFTESAQLA